MENVAFYREWLPLNKKEFRILAMLADFGGEYHGNLTDMCRYFSVSPETSCQGLFIKKNKQQYYLLHYACCVCHLAV